MRVLFVAGGSGGVIFAVTPLALAVRNAGHEVLVATPENTVPTVTSTGLPAVAATDKTMMDFMFADRLGTPLTLPKDPHERLIFNGRGFGRFAAHSLPALTQLTEDWRPDVVVGGALSYSAPLIAAKLGVPHVKHAIDMGEPRVLDLAAAAELGPELAELGLDDLPRPDLFVDVCPPSLRRADAADCQPMRYIPVSSQRRIEPWMYRRGTRPRLLVTAGSRVTKEYDFEVLDGLVRKVSKLDVELLVAAPDDIATDLGSLPENVHAGWIPLDVVVRTTDLLVHHAGGNTMLTAMANGVPQVLIPYLPNVVDYADRLSSFGAAKTIQPGADSAEAIVEAATEVVNDLTYRDRAQEVAAENAAMPTPAEVTGVLEELAATRG
ncbi:nucleotide disphospho-sugar-binding domain-containing protein [Saccharopolyspora gloriosae]|uniref:nucleotide disphospho-sugar-binding domain-containing protein n=1 Tax=Saccharopolyspora gloriosae TaxID=455344 RepID=UPI001FB7D4CC|nr:nucleotide disphospho-sugar-binding domain-containing protein [Saccharopolyspora gloriosae]